ncbi:MAG: hypothetical protein LBH50_00800, partial [Spirochaetaceae bacterium]|jgi:hypothetical protein|nr:hypothetical protein [Spirochaetaceae bacterium]
MAKKGLFVLVLASALAGGAFAQEKTADAGKFWVSGEVSLIGAGVRGEYMLTQKFSVGLNAYWTSLFFFWNDIGVNAFARFYPWGKKFYAGLGLGYAIHTGDENVESGSSSVYTYETVAVVKRNGFGIVPELGFKIDLGRAKGFFLNPHIQLPLILGKKDHSGLWYDDDDSGKFGVSVGFRAALGLGWAF